MNKKQPTVHVTVRMPYPLYQSLYEIAGKDELSLSGVIIRALSASLDDQTGK
jgi:hypothetical protein